MSDLFDQASLVIVGIHADYILPQAAVRAVESADIVFGGVRHHAVIDQHGIKYQKWHTWQSPLEKSLENIAELVKKNLKIVIIASGDPMHYGIGATIRHKIPEIKVVSLPAPSSFSLAANLLGWSLHDCDCLSVHHQPVDVLVPALPSPRRLLCLTKNRSSPHAAAKLLCDHGFEDTLLHILADLASDQQQVMTLSAKQCLNDTPLFPDLHVLAIETRKPAAMSCTSIFSEDDQFIHDGQLTKFPFRAVTLAALRPRPGALLWDIGAGSGSISIGWCQYGGQAIAIEKKAQRIINIKQNSKNILGYYIETRHSDAVSTLNTLRQTQPPDAIFFGGVLRTIVDYMPILPKHGVLVANAVTLSSQAALIDLQRQQGGILRRLYSEEFSPIASHAALQPLRSVLQYQWMPPS